MTLTDNDTDYAERLLQKQGFVPQPVNKEDFRPPYSSWIRRGDVSAARVDVYRDFTGEFWLQLWALNPETRGLRYIRDVAGKIDRNFDGELYDIYDFEAALQELLIAQDEYEETNAPGVRVKLDGFQGAKGDKPSIEIILNWSDLGDLDPQHAQELRAQYGKNISTVASAGTVLTADRKAGAGGRCDLGSTVVGLRMRRDELPAPQRQELLVREVLRLMSLIDDLPRRHKANKPTARALAEALPEWLNRHPEVAVGVDEALLKSLR